MEQAVAVMQSHQSKWSPAEMDLLKNTVCKGATNEEFKVFCYAVQRTGLDPFMKQIHAVKRFNHKTNKEDMSIQIGIDGFRLIADRTGRYAGNDEPIFDNDREPQKATVTVYKMVGDQRCPFTASAKWAEYYPGDKQGFMWRKMPCVMLGKVAEALALRKAFPAELSGLYTDDEMAQADRDRQVVDPRMLEVKKIVELQKELQISDEEFKAELHREFKIETLKGQSMEMLSKIREFLEKQNAALEAEPAPKAAWESETLAMGPIKS